MKIGQYEVTIKTEPNIPENEIRFIDYKNKELGRIINIALK